MEFEQQPKKTYPKRDRTPRETSPEEQYPRALKRCVHLLAKRDYTAFQLAQKLKNCRRPIDQAVINQVLLKLESKKLIKSNLEIARMLIGMYMRQKRGSYWIIQKLRTQGIDLTKAQSQELGLFDQAADLEGATAWAERKFGKLLESTDQKVKARIFRSLASRGFSMDVIKAITRRKIVD